MRPRTLSLLVTLAVFMGGLALVWALGGQRGGKVVHGERTFLFPLNASTGTVSVRSHWKLGHMTPQDDEVELTLVGECATAHLYAYLSTGWSQGPLSTASVILGMPLHPPAGPAPVVVRDTPQSAILVSRESQRGVLVLRASPRDYDALLVQWDGTSNCRGDQRVRASRELGRLFETFKVATPGAAMPAVRAS